MVFVTHDSSCVYTIHSRCNVTYANSVTFVTHGMWLRKVLASTRSIRDVTTLYANNVTYHCRNQDRLNHHHHHQVALTAKSSLSLSPSSLAIYPCHPLLLPSPLDCIQCPYKADVSKSPLVNQHWRVHLQQFIREYNLWVCSCFFSNTSHVLFFWFGWSWRWEISVRTATISSFFFCLKHVFSFIYFHIEVNISRCLLLVMQNNSHYFLN